MRCLLWLICLLWVSTLPANAAEKTMIDFKVEENEVVFSYLPLDSGECAILHLPNNRNFLINAGVKEDEEEIFQFLRQFHIEKLDGILLTSMVNSTTIQNLQKKYGMEELVLLAPLTINAKSLFLKQTTISKGEKWSIDEGVEIEVNYEGEGVNFLIKFHNHELFWMENLNENIEGIHLNQELQKVNILKLPLWSKSYFVSDKFIHHLDAQTAVIGNNGTVIKKNEDLLEAFYETWVDVYFTKQNGLISIKFNKNNYEVLTFPKNSFIDK
ncbi:hypothetical protein [Bacillus sp. 2205SS5-2]|uniref:hypothetical protein n=1 Tax=Bacillus sp. 2205SS5-2 TaxID=3109031 RepID=UPI0030047A43